MSKFVQAAIVAGLIGAAATGIILTDSATKKDAGSFQSSRALQPSQVDPVRVTWSCPTKPVAPDRIGCWIDAEKHDTAYADCTDPKKMSTCKYDQLSPSGKVIATREEECPACLDHCESALKAAYDAAQTDYDAKADQCPSGMVVSGAHCLCLSDKAARPADALDVNATPASGKVVLYGGCAVPEHNGWRRADLAIPAGCTALSSPLVDPVSMNGIETSFDRDMATRCAPYPITPGHHGACPTCQLWHDGCPPCELAGKYGDGWRSLPCLCTEDGCCGDRACTASIGETCKTCPADCGPCIGPHGEPGDLEGKP